MPLYRTSGVLTGTIEAENVAQAQAYLTDDDMTQYLDKECGPIEHIEWKLEADGHNWSVTAYTQRELTDDELKALSSWISGQNSDGLGESFEQQDFAWDQEPAEEQDCSYCHGRGTVTEFVDEELTEKDCEECDGSGYFEEQDDGRMISFDWETNDCSLERVK